MGISIDYELVGTGWSKCVVRTDHQQAEITASYLCNALGSLAAAAVLLLEGATDARFSFEQEPGEYRWVIEQSDNKVRVRILEFDDFYGDQPDEEGRLRLDGYCSIDDFVRAVHRALKVVLARYGLDGYRERWVEHDFPKAELETLETRLNP